MRRLAHRSPELFFVDRIFTCEKVMRYLYKTLAVGLLRDVVPSAMRMMSVRADCAGEGLIFVRRLGVDDFGMLPDRIHVPFASGLSVAGQYLLAYVVGVTRVTSGLIKARGKYPLAYGVSGVKTPRTTHCYILLARWLRAIEFLSTHRGEYLPLDIAADLDGAPIPTTDRLTRIWNRCDRLLQLDPPRPEMDWGRATALLLSSERDAIAAADATMTATRGVAFATPSGVSTQSAIIVAPEIEQLAEQAFASPQDQIVQYRIGDHMIFGPSGL